MDERRSVFSHSLHFSGLPVVRSGCFGFLESFVCYVSCGIFIFSVYCVDLSQVFLHSSFLFFSVGFYVSFDG